MRLPQAESGTRARILRAAIERYGNDGFHVGLRAIAGDVGITAAAVLKHFGSKDDLRKECDAAVIGAIAEAKSEATGSPDLRGSFFESMAVLDEYQPLVRYVLRSILDGGEFARDFLRQMQEQAVVWMRQGVEAGHIKPSRDERLRVKLALGISLGWMVQSTIASGRPLSELDASFWSATIAEMMLPALELYTQGLLTDSAMFDDYLAQRGASSIDRNHERDADQ